MDELVEEIMEDVMGGWMAYSLCGARVEARRMLEHAAKVHPKLAKTETHVRRNI